MKPIQRATFKKAERLKSRKLIELIFTEGDSFVQFPVRFVYGLAALPSSVPMQTAVSVSKKQFKTAVSRNRIKRLLRESFRIQKHSLYHALQSQNKQLVLMILYVGKKEPEFHELKEIIKVSLERLEEQLNQASISSLSYTINPIKRQNIHEKNIK